MGRKPKPKPAADFQEQITKAVLDNGGEDRGSSLRINGWIIKLNSRGVYWHTTFEDGFKEAITGLTTVEDKGGKPYTPRKVLFQSDLDKILNKVLAYKSVRFKKRAMKAAAAAERADKRRLAKRAWCKGCTLGTHKNKCDFMKSFEEELGVIRCTNKGFYENYWCKNVEVRNAPAGKPFFGEYWCKTTGEKCPYETGSPVNSAIRGLGRTTDGEHFSQCSFYRGDKEDTTLV